MHTLGVARAKATQSKVHQEEDPAPTASSPSPPFHWVDFFHVSPSLVVRGAAAAAESQQAVKSVFSAAEFTGRGLFSFILGEQRGENSCPLCCW